MCSLGLFATILDFLTFLWTLITSHFFAVATAAFGATIIDDFEGGTLKEDTVDYEDIEVTCAPVPQIVLTSSSSTDVFSFTTALDTRSTPVTLLNNHCKMISLDDTMAADLWRIRAESTGVASFEPKHAGSPSITRTTSPPLFSLSGDDDDNDVSELAYLCAEPIEERADSPVSLFFSDSCCSSESDHSSPASLLFDDIECHISTFTDDSVDAIRSETAFASPAPKLPRSSSHPVLAIDVSETVDVEPSSPSPVDSGYGSRPDTPYVEKAQIGESAQSPVDDSPLFSDEASHLRLHTLSDVKRGDCVADAKTAESPAPQGPVIPRIVLFDEEGRIMEAAFENEGFSHPAPFLIDEEVDSPYGGLMSIVDSGRVEPIGPVRATNTKVQSSATGAVLDRAFVSLSRPSVPAIPSTITPVYRNCRRAPTFVLDCLEEEEEEERDVVEEEAEEVAARCEEVLCVRSTVEASNVDVEVGDDCLVCDSLGVKDSGSTSLRMKPHGVEATERSPAAGSTPQSIGECAVSRLQDDEDDECEECGLFFTTPDINYTRLMGTLCQPQVEPAIVFGLLKNKDSAPVNRQLNTAYHVTVEGRSSSPAIAHCVFDCERGYWAESGGLASIGSPRECPAHGGHGACAVGAIFHHPMVLSVLPATDSEISVPDYAKHAVEVVGMAPKPEAKSAEEDCEGDDLVLHSGEKFRPAASKSTVAPKTGAGYDEYMSRFMDDVDLTPSSSTDNVKNAPLGKLGGAFKTTMPEAVDHLKEGLEKTENVFRAAFAAAPFRFNSMADKFVRGHKVQASREKLPVNEYCLKESSASSMKAKWSNMLNKFTR